LEVSISLTTKLIENGPSSIIYPTHLIMSSIVQISLSGLNNKEKFI
jgi:hypothetical protein